MGRQRRQPGVQRHHPRRPRNGLQIPRACAPRVRRGERQERELLNRNGDRAAMKIRVSQKVHYDSGPNMTPLVDVVMVILIFLMLTGSFGAASHFLPSTMPIKEKGKGQIDPKKIPKVPDPQMEIFISSDPTSNTFRARI